MIREIQEKLKTSFVCLGTSELSVCHESPRKTAKDNIVPPRKNVLA